MKCEWCGGDDAELVNVNVFLPVWEAVHRVCESPELCAECYEYTIDGVRTLLDPANRPGKTEEVKP